MQVKQLLVNADDFGLTAAVTDGIIEAHQRGIVTCTSIMAGGLAFEHAVKLAFDNKSLDVGVHLTLVEEQPVADPKDIPTLVQANGKLPRNYSELLSGLLLGRIRIEHIEHELRAQVMKCLDAGLKPTHLDSHQHVHALPAILRLVVRLADEFNIRGIRLPRDSPAFPAVLSQAGLLQKTLLCMLARYDGYLIRAKPFSLCGRMAGLFESGSLCEKRLLAILGRLPAGTTELVCHPGREDANSSTTYAHWHYNWATELTALTSKAVRDTLVAQNIQLITYADLKTNFPSPISSAGPVR